MYSCIHLLSPFPFLSLSIYLSLWLESTQTHSIAAQSGSVRSGPVPGVRCLFMIL